VTGATVREAIDALEAVYPGVRARLMEGDALRPGIAVAVDGSLSGKKLRQRLEENSEVHFVPAIGGG
jgi:molybdopterin synthase sulfur carrier subunit